MREGLSEGDRQGASGCEAGREGERMVGLKGGKEREREGERERERESKKERMEGVRMEGERDWEA